MKPFDLTGQRFGRLQVVSEAVRTDHIRWSCSCDCGGSVVTTTSQLRSGKTSSCGCLHKELAKIRIQNRNAKQKMLPAEEAGLNRLIRDYKYGAVNRGLAWDLTKSQCIGLFEKACHYCGSPPASLARAKRIAEAGGYIYSGIDRKDNSKGYSVENCVSCCTVCNRAKRDMSYGDFVSWIKDLIRFNLGDRLHG